MCAGRGLRLTAHWPKRMVRAQYKARGIGAYIRTATNVAYLDVWSVLSHRVWCAGARERGRRARARVRFCRQLRVQPRRARASQRDAAARRAVGQRGISVCATKWDSGIVRHRPLVFWSVSAHSGTPSDPATGQWAAGGLAAPRGRARHSSSNSSTSKRAICACSSAQVQENGAWWKLLFDAVMEVQRSARGHFHRRLPEVNGGLPGNSYSGRPG